MSKILFTSESVTEDILIKYVTRYPTPFGCFTGTGSHEPSCLRNSDHYRTGTGYG